MIATAQRVLPVHVGDVADVAVINDESGVGLSRSRVPSGLDEIVAANGGGVVAELALVEIASDHDNAARRIHVDFESSFGRDDAVVVVVVQVGDVIAVFVVEAELLEGDGDLAGGAVRAAVEKDDGVTVAALKHGHDRPGPDLDAFLLQMTRFG